MSSLPNSPEDFVPVGRSASADPRSARASVAIGFGSPSGDTGVTRLDLNDLLISHPEATVMMRVAGDAMREAGIDNGDLLLVDRAIDARHGHVVVAVVGDEFACRRLSLQGADVRLTAEAPGIPDILIDDARPLQVWGVVTRVIKSLPT